MGSWPPSVAVAGGSLGGLCAGVALRGVGCAVDVYERAAGPLRSRGAGIVVQPELLDLLRAAGAPALPTTSCRHRRHLDVSGDGSRRTMPQRFTSWGAIYSTLRAVFPAERYHAGAAVDLVDPAAGRLAVAGQGERDADLVVCADGSRSASRARLLPALAPSHAGYVAWRGTLEEATAPSELIAFVDDHFTFGAAASGGHLLAYMIPGKRPRPTPAAAR